ncbi:MAG: SRPBCC family protein [Flavobacteriaceae bacterium]
MVTVVTQITINKGIKTVSEYASNPENAPEWYVNIKSFEWKTPKPLAVGSQLAFSAHFLGRVLEYTYEVVEFIPGLKLVMLTAEGPFPMETTYTWESVDDNTTLMTLQNKGKPSGFSKIFSPIMSAAMRRANKKDLKLLKTILEKAGDQVL